MPGNFKCTRCKELFRDNNDLKRHLERKKPCYPKNQPPDGPEWTCGPCRSSFTTKGHYETHLKSQTHARMTNEASPIDHSNMPIEEAVDEGPTEHVAGPSNSSYARDDQAVDFALSTVDTSKIRKTNENPPRVAVLDLISIVTNQTISNSSVTFSRLCQNYPEVTTGCSDFKFKGRGQKFIPVTNAKGAVMIINALPGKVAAKLRIEWADVIVRYLGGDLTLVQEIAHNRTVQDNTPDDHPLRFFGQAVESRPLPGSVTGVQDMRQPQVYLGYAGPPEDWTDIKRSDGSPFVPREDQLIFKFGQNDFNTNRNLAHLREFGTWQVIDSVLTDNPPKVERIAKDELRNKNDLLSAVHKNKTKRDMEVIAADHSEYMTIVQRIQEIAAKSKIAELNMDFERELTKRLEFETRKAEAEAEAESQAKMAEARTAEANASVRLLELQIELKRLELAQE